MEESKAAAYYDELSRRGEGAARFKRGLGFSSGDDSSSSLQKPPSVSVSPLSNFVRASSPSKAEKQAQLASVQNKLRRSRGDDVSDMQRRRRRSRSRSSDQDDEKRRRRSRSGERDGDRRRRSRSRSIERDNERQRRRSRSRDGDGDRRLRRSQSRDRVKGSRHRDREYDRSHRPPPKHEKSRSSTGTTDYSQLIKGYSEMTPAEKVKAKMKHQISQTAAKDTSMGLKSGWERFDFNKEAPLDDDELEVAEDDASLVKDIGRSFRFSAVEAKREEDIKVAHDHAMFGTPVAISTSTDPGITEDENATKDESEQQNSDLISEKVLTMQQGSWRDRARKTQSRD